MKNIEYGFDLTKQIHHFHLLFESMTDVCPICQRRFKSLRKHFGKSYRCSTEVDLLQREITCGPPLHASTLLPAKRPASSLDSAELPNTRERRSVRISDLEENVLNFVAPQPIRTTRYGISNVEMDDSFQPPVEHDVYMDPMDALPSSPSSRTSEDMEASSTSSGFSFHYFDESHSNAAVAQHTSKDVNPDRLPLTAPCLDDDKTKEKLVGVTIRFPVSEIESRLPSLSDTERACVDLQMVLFDCPLRTFDKVTGVIKEHSANGFKSDKQIPVRKTLLNKFKKIFPSPMPEFHKVYLETGNEDDRENFTMTPHDWVIVVCYNPKDQLIDLLSDIRLFGDADNLVVNKDAPFSLYKKQSDFDGEMHAHHWYQATYKATVTDPKKQFLLCIILAADKTGTDANQRFGGEPVLMSVSIIKGGVRRQSKCWRVIGYIPDLEHGSSAKKRKISSTVAGKGRSQRNYHKCFEIFLEGFDVLENGFYFDVRLGDLISRRFVMCRLSFLVGDGKSGDVASNRFLGKGTARVCRACNVDHTNLTNPKFDCKFAMASDFTELSKRALDRNLSKKERLKARNKLWSLSQHVCLNAFRDRNFGENSFGITLGSASDMMHLFELGIIKYLLMVFVCSMTDATKVLVDALLDRLFLHHRSSERDHHLRMNFVRGATQLTLLASHEWMGLMFSFYVMLLTKEGRDICERCFSLDDCVHEPPSDVELPSFDGINIPFMSVDVLGTTPNVDTNEIPGTENDSVVEDDIPDDTIDDDDGDSKDDCSVEEETTNVPVKQLNCSYRQFVDLLEHLLIFHAFYKSDKSPFSLSSSRAGCQEISNRMRRLLHKIVTFCPRNIGHGWNVQKLHEFLHYPLFIFLFGCSDNWDACHLERNLKTFVKAIARLCQKRVQPEFLRQMGKRLVERSMFHKAAAVVASRFEKKMKQKQNKPDFGVDPSMKFARIVCRTNLFSNGLVNHQADLQLHPLRHFTSLR